MRAYCSCLLLALVAALFIPISAGAQADIDCVALVDSDSTRVARAVQDVEVNAIDFYVRHNGLAIPLRVVNQTIVGSTGTQTIIGDGGIVWFVDADCSSQPLIPVSENLNSTILPASAVVAEQNVYYSDPASVPQRIEVLSLKHDDNGICSPDTREIAAVPAVAQFEIPQYMSPYHLEPEPCFTPPDPDPEQIINACVKNKGGAMRMVADPADCTARETPITLLSP